MAEQKSLGAAGGRSMTGSGVFDDLADESDGILAVFVLGQTEIRALMGASQGGDVSASHLLKAAAVSIQKIEEAPRRDPMPCGCCGNPVKHRSNYKIGIVVPDIDRPLRAMGFGLCLNHVQFETDSRALGFVARCSHIASFA